MGGGGGWYAMREHTLLYPLKIDVCRTRRQEGEADENVSCLSMNAQRHGDRNSCEFHAR